MPATVRKKTSLKRLRWCVAGSTAAVTTLFGVSLFPIHALCQVPEGFDSALSSVDVSASSSAPELRAGREIALLGVGTGLLAAHALLPSPAKGRVIPAQGLSPIEIAWSLDRDVVGNRSVRADRASDWTFRALLALPLVLAATTSDAGERWRDFGSSTLVYAETFLASQGITRLLKSTLGRPRPYAYMPMSSRPTESTYDVSHDRTFRSMPSGHSASAWTAAAFGITEHVLRRPNASLLERVGVGVLGGTLAGATSTLRVEAGQHFPSDVVVGAGIGVLTGVTLPLLHRDGRSLPTSGAWLQAVGGVAAGTLFGIILARTY